MSLNFNEEESAKFSNGENCLTLLVHIEIQVSSDIIHQPKLKWRYIIQTKQRDVVVAMVAIK